MRPLGRRSEGFELKAATERANKNQARHAVMWAHVRMRLFTMLQGGRATGHALLFSARLCVKTIQETSKRAAGHPHHMSGHACLPHARNTGRLPPRAGPPWRASALSSCSSLHACTRSRRRAHSAGRPTTPSRSIAYLKNVPLPSQRSHTVDVKSVPSFSTSPILTFLASPRDSR